jgi:hypothetical protein
MKICAILVKVLQQTKENCSNALALSLVFDLPSVIVYQRRREVRKFEGAGGTNDSLHVSHPPASAAPVKISSIRKNCAVF